MNEYRYQADWQPYAYPEDTAFLATDREIENILEAVDLTKDHCLSAGIPLRVVHHTAYINAATENTLIFGETGCKKTRSCIRPQLYITANAHESMIVHDPKGELATDAALRQHLDKRGYRTVFLDFRSLTADGYNLLEFPFRLYLANQQDQAMKLVFQVINSLVDPEDKSDPFWNIMAIQFLVGILYILFDVCSKKRKYHQFVNFFTLSLYCNDEACSQLSALLDNYMSEQHNSATSMLRGVLSAPEKTRSSIIATASSLLRDFVIQKQLCAMLSSSTFHVTDLYGIPTIIFLVTPDEDSSMNKLVALMIDQIYQQLIQQYTAVYQGKNTPIRVNFIIDEFCNLSISDMANKISISRSRHLCWTLVAQSKAQLEAKYKESAATILGNCQNIIFLNSSDPTLLEYISQLSGRSSIGTSQNHPYRIQPEHLRKLKKTYEYKEAVWIRDDICYQATLPDIDQYPYAKMYSPGYYSIPIHARLPVAAYPPVQLMRDISHGVIPKPFN